MPYRLTVRVVTDLLVIAFVLGLGVLASTLAQPPAVAIPPAETFPWTAVIQGAITILTAVLAWLVKNQVTELHTTINSKMDALLKLTAAASKAEGVKEERDRAEVAHAAGVSAAANTAAAATAAATAASDALQAGADAKARQRAAHPITGTPDP